MISHTSALSFRDQIRRHHIHARTGSQFAHEPPDVADAPLTANRTAKATARRIAELEEQVAQLQAEAAQPAAPPAPPAADAKIVRRGRPPGRRKGIDPGDAVPPGAAVQDPKPLDEEASAARDALEENLSGR